MRVGVVASDVPPCELYRARGPAEVLAQQGDIEFVRLTETLRVRVAIREHGPSQPVGLIDPPDVDVIVFTRGVFPERMHEIIRFLQRDGIAVVVDFDDAYDRLPTALHALYKINPKQNPYYNWRHAIEAAKLADLVTVSTPPLLRYRQDAVVLKNAVPEHYLDVRAHRDGKTVGWAGTIAGHPGDLRVCGSGVAEAIRDADGRFLNVGDGVGVKQDLGLSEVPDVTGIVGLDEYPRHIARFDVSISPLVSNSYAEAKSWLKPLEALAMGSAYVSSITSEYQSLYDELVEWCAMHDAPVPGALAGPRRREWKREVLKALRRSPEQRQEVSEAARAFVWERHTLQQRAYQWGDAWEEAMRRTKTKGRVMA